jgi:uncharacterized RDD family membrane protein YckC
MLERPEEERPAGREDAGAGSVSRGSPGAPRPLGDSPLGVAASSETEPGAPRPSPEISPSSTSVLVAGLWRRLAASILDGLILTPVFLLVGWMALRVTGVRLPPRSDLRLESILELFLEGGSLLYGLLSLALLLLLLYGFLFTATVGGTPGQRLIGLKVINTYGERPEWWRAMSRAVGIVASGLLLGLGFLWIGFDLRKRGLHDWMAGTYVVLRRVL